MADFHNYLNVPPDVYWNTPKSHLDAIAQSAVEKNEREKQATQNG